MSIIHPIPHLLGENLRSQSETWNFSQCVGAIVENAVDAQATVINISIDSDTLSFTCRDNGKGISRDDLIVIGLPFYSSKLSDLTDIPSSYGFKGSWLYNISNISMTTITSQYKNDIYRTRIHYGKRIILGRRITDEMKTGTVVEITEMKTGTVVEVSNLFAKQPVRKEYFKSKQNWTNEISKLKRFLAIISICSPSIELQLQVDKGEIIRIPSNLSIKLSRELQILANFNKSEIKNFTELSITENDIQITGLIYSFASGTSDRLVLLNRRHLGSKSSYQKINKLMNDESYLFQVNFKQTAGDLFQNASFDIFDSERLSEIEQMLLSLVKDFKNGDLGAVSQSNKQLQKSAEYLAFEKVPSLRTKATGSREILSKFFIKTFRLMSTDLSNAKIIAQIDQKFIMIRTKNRIILVDQHAADERIKLETSLTKFKFGNVDPIKLTSSIRFKVSADDVALATLSMQKFTKWGIIYSIDSTSHIEISAVPEILRFKSKQKDFLKNLILTHIHTETTSSQSTIEELPQMLIDTLKSNACRSAIMFGDKLTITECQTLIAKLANCQRPFACAHGRPSAVPVASLD